MRAGLLRSIGSIPGGLGNYRRETGISWWTWLLVALLNLAAQIIFRRNLAPGEFATLNSLLGLVGLMAVPLVALRLALAYFPAREKDPARREVFQQAHLPLVQTASLVWGFFCALVFLPALDLLELPRFTMGLFALPNVIVVVAGCFCASLYEQQNRLGFWAGLLVGAGVMRVLTGLVLTGAEPWTESGLAAGIIAGLMLLTPILRPTKLAFGWGKAGAAWRDREFRIYLGATLSVVVGIFLFTNADRIVAQIWFGRSTDNNLGLVRWGLFDGYQTAGLLGRALLWSTQPILFVLLAQRARENRTSPEMRNLFWLYLVALVAGALLLPLLAIPLGKLFGGADDELTAFFIPRFALAMVPLGMLQGLGIFVLASRRYPECFTLGAGSLAYTLLLVLVGKPQLMQSYMLGGGTVALLVVLFIGVVRWGRKQP